MFLFVLFAICVLITYLLIKSDNKRIHLESLDGIVLSDPNAKYLGGFPDVAGSKNVHFAIKKDEIVITIYVMPTPIIRHISMKDIVDAEIKSETQINNEVSLGKIALFGVLALGMNSKTTTVNNYLVLTYMEYGRQRDIIIKSNNLENLVRTIRNLINK